MVFVVKVAPPEAAAARSLLLAASINATTGGVTAAKRPAFSRNRRRSASFAVQFAASSGMCDVGVPHPHIALRPKVTLATRDLARLSLGSATKVERPPVASGTSRRNTRLSHANAADWERRRSRTPAERTCIA